MYEYWIHKKLKCTKDEKVEIFVFLDNLLELSSKAKQGGLFELEKEKSIVSEALLKKGIELMVDGTEPEILKKILLNYLICGDKKAKDFLKGILIIESILCIQQGWHPNLLKEMLLSYLGEEMIEDAEIYYKNSDKYRTDLVKQYLDELPKKEVTGNTYNLEGPFEKMSARCIQRLLREIDYEMIAVALKGVSKKVQEKILSNVSPRLAVLIIESINNMTRVSSADIVEAQRAMLEITKELVKDGEIVI